MEKIQTCCCSVIFFILFISSNSSHGTSTMRKIAEIFTTEILLSVVIGVGDMGGTSVYVMRKYTEYI